MAELILILKGREIRRVPVNKAKLVIGRDPTCDLFIDNPGVSRSHAHLIMTEDHFRVVDHGSANGTYVNGYRIQEHKLKDGDQVKIAKFTIIYSAKTGPSFVITPDARTAVDAPQRLENPQSTVFLSHSEISSMLDEGQARMGSTSQTPTTAPHRVPPPAAARSRRTILLLSLVVILLLSALATVGILLLAGK